MSDKHKKKAVFYSVGNETQRWPSPEEVDDTLEVSGDQHHQRDDGGEDQRRGRSKPVDVSHGQDIWLQNKTNRVTILSFTINNVSIR